jgi:hypothetical protein
MGDFMWMFDERYRPVPILYLLERVLRLVRASA